MSTDIRPEVSQQNPYWISKERYYELRHFCLQYKDWQKMYRFFTSPDAPTSPLIFSARGSSHSDTVAHCAEMAAFYSERIAMVDRAAKECDDILWDYIRIGVTEGRAYTNLRLVYNIPCCKDIYYDLYRKFFWILNRIRR